jgi:hypothetical protein
MIGILGFDSRRGLGIFLFTASRTALGPTHPPIQWVAGAPSLEVKRLGREADHSPPPSIEVKEWVELYPHSPNTSSWRGVQFRKKHRDNFTFTLPLSTLFRLQQLHHIEWDRTMNMNSEWWIRICKTAEVTYFTIQLWYFLGENKESHENPQPSKREVVPVLHNVSRYECKSLA